MPIGFQFYINNNDKKDPEITIQSAIALEIFEMCFGIDTFIHNPPKPKGSLKEIMEECMDAADVLLATKDKDGRED